MDTAEIRRRYLRFFGERGHTVVPSASLLLDDPNLLFVNAGMVPFKPYLLGQENPPYPRASSVQKCVRTGDIEEVGKTTRHGTFFQMNGNFSFGDYFKEQAIEYAWELITRPVADGGFGLPESRIWVTVYHEDDEAAGIWQHLIGLPEHRIVRRGMTDNLWSMGVPGPCGPCSELYIDRGPEYGPEGGPEVDEDRYLEFWNLVFMQWIRGEGPAKEGYELLGDLPAKNIDTGMGLERMAALLQGVDNIYENDEIRPVLDRATELSGRSYGADHQTDVRLRVVADHVRSALMIVSDGISPGNEGRGYVLRRIIRRAVNQMRLLGVDEATMPALLPVSQSRMKLSYPELETDWQRISSVVYAEEETFLGTLKTGAQIFDLAATETTKSGGSVLAGARAFQLHDTYGFPFDLTMEMAAERGLSVDEEGFRRLMAEQRTRAKQDAASRKTAHADLSAYRSVADTLGRSVEFTGYDEVRSEGRVAGLLVGGEPVTSAREGETVELVLDRTPFYAESGGQLADEGVVELANGARLVVHDVQSPLSGLIVHQAKVLEGEVVAGTVAQALVDVERRRAISRAHTATHMVHKAFREALGETAAQAGSENAPGRFRFDFTSTGPVPESVLAEAEERVNDLLLADLPVTAEEMPLVDARQAGAMALFGEKYPDVVRVISVGDWARELCGGTHAGRSGQLGVVKLLTESSIGAGIRRVEALVGADAYRFLAREHVLLGQLAEAVKARPEELPERVAGIIDRLRTAEKELERIRVQQVLAAAGQLAANPKDVFGVALVAHRVDGASAGDLRKLALDVRGRMPSDRPAVVAVVGASGGRPSVVVAVNDEARNWRLSAGALVKIAAGVLGGGGGGKDDVAQGGGTDPGQADEALREVEYAVGTRVTSS
ncbi:alanyl-tRNA synthetase [Actinopolymorpha cephalotaxi]|uniref:Alanine--tRNA ligase n=1 Tax=Actinopolymorpha cephalotaxi TaxID=504797 RepID=A0A1I2PXD9_9ACTN|nr:alanine--tRNA ligase [Actinopolymorpha cephalotaxi]NYH83464.1 alanyl-tRNA synthetase [Actinopolymorpha cephalotaxi]SFG19799.1 alanyl-tRNA synthetase [Actinopolymorpha cephalotaxi]